MVRLVAVAAHPDDAESGCGGLILNAVASGGEVVILCMTRGQKAPPENSARVNARIRSEEARRGARVLGAGIEFGEFIDGEVVLTRQTEARTARMIRRLSPDMVLAHWPIDTHPDHQACGTLAMRASLNDPSYTLYFFEVLTGTQSMNFVPTNHVDITSNRDRKKEACLVHKSQRPEKWLHHHELMEKFRGREIGVPYAEAYVRAGHSPSPCALQPSAAYELLE